jgi:hypothetical protein
MNDNGRKLVNYAVHFWGDLFSTAVLLAEWECHMKMLDPISFLQPPQDLQFYTMGTEGLAWTSHGPQGQGSSLRNLREERGFLRLVSVVLKRWRFWAEPCRSGHNARQTVHGEMRGEAGRGGLGEGVHRGGLVGFCGHRICTTGL